MQTLKAAVAGDPAATAAVLSEVEDLIHASADTEEEQHVSRVRLWSAMPGFQGDNWEDFREYARTVL